MNPIQKYLAPMLSRLIGVVVAAVSTMLFNQFGILIDTGTQQEIVTMAVFMIIYVITNRLIARKTNPDDVAKPRIEIPPDTSPMTVPPVLTVSEKTTLNRM